MAAYNFPNSPSDGATVTSNGITYTYSSSKTRWDGAAASGSSTTVYATIDLLPLSGVSTGDQAFVTGNNRLYIWNGTGWYNIALINTTPSISGASASYALATDGTATTVTITATDPEGIPIVYSIASDTSGNVATVTQGTGASANVFTITPSTNSANAGTFSLTFRASDGVNIATAVSSFTLQFSVENSNYTTALITSVGANNAVNNSFTDSSTNNHTITANGNVTQNTFSPYRHGGYSTYFDGTGDYLTVPDDTSLDFGTGDFTVECWINLPERSSGNPIIFGSSWYIQLKTGDTKISFWGGGGTEQIYTGTALELNRWYHIAVVRDNGQITMYLDGSSVLTSAYTTSVNTATNVSIGRSTSTAFYFKGYIRDVRIVKGSAIVPASGGPIDSLTAVTNTSLLTCHLPYIADGSTNAHSITVNGDTKTEPFSPYDHNGYVASDDGGSMYFDGTGDYLTIADSADLDMGSSDFTIEGWYYPHATASTNDGLISKRANSSESNGVLVYSNTTTGHFDLLVAQSGSWAINSRSSIAFKTNVWNHFAVVRNGTSFKLYVNGEAGVSVTSSVTIPDNTSAFTVGAMGADGSNTLPACNIADVRIVKGTAVYTSAFTPPTAPLTAIANTSLLLNGTDAGIIDKSQSVKTITLNGDVKSSTTQSKYLSSSMYFDGTGDYLSCGALGHNFNSGQNTIEMWIYPTNVSSNEPALFEFYTDDGNNFRLQIYTGGGYSGDLRLLTRSGSGSNNIETAGASVVSANSWQHIACVRNSSNYWDVYVDGTKVITGSFVHSFDTTNVDFRIGKVDYGTDRYFEGYMSDFRITKGLSRYTSNFTPPSAALQG